MSRTRFACAAITSSRGPRDELVEHGLRGIALGRDLVTLRPQVTGVEACEDLAFATRSPSSACSSTMRPTRSKASSLARRATTSPV